MDARVGKTWHDGGGRIGRPFDAGVKRITPSFWLCRPGYPAGIDNLDEFAYINGKRVAPLLRYRGADATATDWPAWGGYGPTLALAGSGDAPTLDVKSPFVGANDVGVTFNGAKYYQNSSFGTLSAPALTDVVIVTLARMSTPTVGTYDILLVAHDDAGDTGMIYHSSHSTGVLYSYHGSQVASAAGGYTGGYWDFNITFADENEGTAANAARIYRNGVVTGTGATMADSDLGAVDNVTLGAHYDGGQRSVATLVYAAVYAAADWFAGGAQNVTDWAAWAGEQSAKLFGVWPNRAAGTAAPVTRTRNSNASVDKVEGSARKVYFVGPHWTRYASRDDSASVNVQGYLGERAETNSITEAVDFSEAIWTKTNCTITTASGVTAPDGSVAHAINDGAATGSHYIDHALTLTVATEYTLSVFCKHIASSRWLAFTFSNTPDIFWAYFDIENGVAGSTGADITSSTIEDWGDGWYRCSMVFTTHASDAAGNVRIHSAEGDADASYTGGSEETLAIWGAQIEATDRATTLIKSEGSATSRVVDELTYKMDDGNIGGVGSYLVGAGRVTTLTPPAGDYQSTEVHWTLTDGGATADRVGPFFAADSMRVNTAASGKSAGVVTDTNGPTNAKRTCRVVWRDDDLALYSDGAEVGTRDSDCGMPDDLDTLEVSGYPGQAYELGGLLADLRLYKNPTLADINND